MTSAILVAAGASRRMGFDKLFADLDGLPVVARTLLNFQNAPVIDEIILVTRAEKFADYEALRKEHGLTKVSRIIEGGAERQNSVYNGVCAATNASLVAIHDGARPLATPAQIARVVAEADAHGASVAACKIVDTLKEARDDMSVARTVDRSRMWAVQTPQAFRRALIKEAYETVFARGLVVTDDTAAVELLGHPIRLVDTDRDNIKVTTPEDFAIAAALLQKAAKG